MDWKNWIERDKAEQFRLMNKYASMLYDESGGLFRAIVSETTDGLSMWIISTKCEDCWIKCIDLVRDSGVIYPARLILCLDPLNKGEYFRSNILLERLIQKYVGSNFVYSALCNMDHAINKFNIECGV